MYIYICIGVSVSKNSAIDNDTYNSEILLATKNIFKDEHPLLKSMS